MSQRVPGSYTLTGLHYATGKPITLEIAGGNIQAIGPGRTESRSPTQWIAPGLVELQINGYQQLDFNSLPLSDGLVPQFTRRLWQEGITAYLPTLVTNHGATIEAAARTIARACSDDPYTAAAVKGIHLEGPFISPEDGPRGAHQRAYVQGPDWSLFQRWQAAAQGLIRIVTLSPEWPGAADFIARCVENGVTVAIGHTAATTDQIREAVAAGATMSTHLGNGAHPLLPRHPNYLWDQLAEGSLWACMIADGFHLPASVLKVILKVKETRAMLVSDAVHLSGMPPGEYRLHQQVAVVKTPAGKLHLADQPGLLAGSAQMLMWGIQHLVRKGITDLPTAWEMASVRPARFLGLPAQQGLAPGVPADLVLFRKGPDQSLELVKTYKAGELVFEKTEPPQLSI